jgi:hypothetical protein
MKSAYTGGLTRVEAFPNMRTVAEIVAEEAIPANKTVSLGNRNMG